MELKREVAELFGSKASLNSPAHITLHMPFQYRKDREQSIFETLQSLSNPTFVLNHDGFGAFAPRVIFVNVEHTPQLDFLQSQIKKVCRTQLKLENADYKRQGFHPHMTIAFRDLKKNRFAEAWGHYQNQVFEASWQCQSFWLLQHNGHFWEPYREFFFTTLSHDASII